MGPPFSRQCLPEAPSSSHLGRKLGVSPGMKKSRGPDRPLPWADHQSASVPSVSVLLCGVLPPWRRGGTFPSSFPTVCPRGHQSSPSHPQPRPLCMSTPHLSQSPLARASPGRRAAGDTPRPTPVRKDPKQRRPQPPQRGHPPNPGCTLPACTRLVKNAWSMQDQGQPPTPAFVLSSLSCSCSVLAALPGSVPACAPLHPLRGPALPSGLCPLHPTFPNCCPN